MKPIVRGMGPFHYTCPMHPEIRQSKPGNCTFCGMVLEPETITNDKADTDLGSTSKNGRKLFGRSRVCAQEG